MCMLLALIVSGLAAGADAQGTQTGALRGTVLTSGIGAEPTFPEFSIDPVVIQDRTTPNWYGFTTYRGVVKNNLHAVLDASVNYNIPLWSEMRPWLKLDFFNVLNNRTLIGFNTTVVPDPDGPVDDLGLPTRYIRGRNFGQATGNANFPRVFGAGSGAAFRVAYGLRF